MSQEKYKRINISLEKTLLEQARIECIKKNITFSKYLASLIQKDLNNE